VSPAERDHRDPAEERLDAYLEEVRLDPPQADAQLVKRVAHRARWQRAVREPLRVAGALAAAMIDGLAGFLGTHRRER
jgi:hypothetical protein